MIGIAIFFIIYLIEELTGLVSKFVGGVCCCCFGKAELSSFSTNIFKEISVENL